MQVVRGEDDLQANVLHAGLTAERALEPHPASSPGGGLRRDTPPIFFENGEGHSTRVRWTWGGGSNSRGDAMFSRFLEKMRTDQVTKKAQDEQPSRANNYYSTNVLLLQEAGDNECSTTRSEARIGS